ncbi:MAG TPA: DUF4468 domain-containing protein [Mucilaginibacter sp.]|nr:DUF4468 domain-containing protein [Mucilaginibacter sp.]
MKRILILFSCILTFQIVSAQKSLLSLNEQNKYIYYQVVDLPGAGADSLTKKAAAFVAENKLKGKLSADTTLVIHDKFQTHSSLSFSKHENGEITYTFTIQCKDSKYRFWFTDFTFIPYERDRYGAFVPVSGKEISLDNASSKLEKKELNGYLDQTGAYCQQMGLKLKDYMLQNHTAKKTAAPVVKKVVTDKW